MPGFERKWFAGLFAREIFAPGDVAKAAVLPAAGREEGRAGTCWADSAWAENAKK